ncbi:hypothetical protein LTR86_010644 [Recurvomyces mirabilis]|nr:hypothetical protein LTR86_010644 [Recurvomyces mirabilis]
MLLRTKKRRADRVAAIKSQLADDIIALKKKGNKEIDAVREEHDKESAVSETEYAARDNKLAQHIAAAQILADRDREDAERSDSVAAKYRMNEEALQKENAKYQALCEARQAALAATLPTDDEIVTLDDSDESPLRPIKH